MLDALFPDRGYYRYTLSQIGGEVEIIGPYPTYEQALGLFSTRNYFVRIDVKYHLRRPEGSIQKVKVEGQ